ncbi:MAG: NADH-quinone oxidoreductase subunit M [Pseudomonadota bacterium]
MSPHDPAILIWLIAIPFAGGLFCWLFERTLGIAFPRWVALFTMLSVLGLSCWLWATGDYSLSGIGAEPKWALEYRAPWIDRFGISFHLGLDGLSLLLIVLTNILGVMAVACSWKEIGRYVGFFHLNLLWNLAGVVAVFLALDMFLFFFFWEMMLVPMWFLIAIWGHDTPGGKSRTYAATKFFIFTQASGLLLLLAILGLAFAHHSSTGTWSFDYEDLLKTPMSAGLEYLLMLGFFVAFMVKMPVVPFHTWLPDAHSQAPTAGSVDLAGILLKTAAYGLMRFGLPFFPNASADFAPIAMWLGAVGIVYGAFMTFAQTDVKRLVAYSSISHMGFVLIGIYAGTELALQGAVVTMIAHGISAGALFILCGEVYERLHTRDIRKMGGLWSTFPYLPPILLFFMMAALGLPGLGNFVGEFLVLLGTFKVDLMVTLVAASGLILAAVYALYMIQRVLHGVSKSEVQAEDLNRREITMLVTLMILLLALGLYPQPVLDASAAPMRALAALYSAGATP